MLQQVILINDIILVFIVMVLKLKKTWLLTGIIRVNMTPKTTGFKRRSLKLD